MDPQYPKYLCGIWRVRGKLYRVTDVEPDGPSLTQYTARVVEVGAPDIGIRVEGTMRQVLPSTGRRAEVWHPLIGHPKGAPGERVRINSIVETKVETRVHR